MTTGESLIEKWPELRKLTERQILAGAKRWAGEEREAQMKFLLYLAEVERREAYEHDDKRSLWEFLEETLRFSKCETRLRFHSAKLLLRFPIAATYLADGRLSMTTLVVLKDVLTEANVRVELDKASNKSKVEVEKQAAEHHSPILDFAKITAGPEPTITKAEPPPLSASHAAKPAESASSTKLAAPTDPGATYFVENAPSKSAVKALAKGQSLLTMTLTDEQQADLGELGDLLSELFPDKSLHKIVGYCIRTTKERLQKKRGKLLAVQPAEPAPETPAQAATTEAPKPKPYKLEKVVVPKDAAIEGRNRDRAFTRDAIPQWMAKAVWIRDNHRCQRRLKGGQICGSTYRCQLDHIDAVADGGANTLDNLRVHCRRHNLQRARERFGTERVDRAIRLRQEQQRERRKAKELGRVSKTPSLFREPPT